MIRVGNLGRNTECSFGTNVTDLTLLKRTRFTESVNFEVRAELFNALNRPQFSAGHSTANALSQGLFLQAINSDHQRRRTNGSLSGEVGILGIFVFSFTTSNITKPVRQMYVFAALVL